MTTFRLFLHVLAGLVPTVRDFGPDAPAKVARAFNRIAWPAFAVAVLTGLWNVMAVPLGDLEHPWVELHVLAVLVSGLGAVAHQLARGNRTLLAVGGAVSSVFAVAAMYLGLVLAT